jgi:aminopeptidase N
MFHTTFRYPVKVAVILLFSSMPCLITYSQTYQTAIPVEKGVSQRLAIYRKTILGNINYRLHFDIPADKEQSIPATESIAFTLSNNTAPLQVDFKEERNHIQTIKVNQRSIPVDFEKEHILIAPAYLKKGSNIVEITFTAGNLSLNRNQDFLYTLLVPDRARTLFPCFDQPNLKATFTLTLTIPPMWKAVSNAPLQDSTLAPGSKTYRYAKSHIIPTYLFSFAAGKFDHITEVVNGRTMNFYHRETDSSKIRLSTDSIFHIHGLALQYLQQYTGIRYPFKKFDFIAIPDFQYGGMEHVGAIQYRASSLFLDSGATKEQLNARANLISHETSHMWFGDLVTMQWFNDVWMKEVFANFMADKITRGNQPVSTYELKFLIDHYPAAYSIDRTAGANPIRQQLDNLQEAGTLYGNIIYHKAPIMMRQLERLMGKEAFRDGLRQYLKKYKFGNATWPDLISILDARTPANLIAWNKVWVNEAGRPEITYTLRQNNGIISDFTIRQQGELHPRNILPQFFEIALVYGDSIKEVTVNMRQQQVVLNALSGKKVPDFILFNSSGEGYGLFPVDSNMLPHLATLQSAVMRASAYINLYENMLSGKAIKPKELMQLYENQFAKEKEELNLRLITGYTSDIFWRLILPTERERLAPFLEDILWQDMQQDTVANKKKILFKTYQNVALSQAALDTLYAMWKTEKAPKGVILTEDDYTALALTLALKNYPDTNILQQQVTRINNPDRKARLEFLMPALSSDSTVRDAFFASLKEQKNRQKEAWVTMALDYLHHPLRASTSQKYLKQTLDLLEEIQRTGDIFFPGTWLQSSFGAYQSPAAATIVRTFLQKHPNYNPKLKAKILQAADPLFRAERLVYGK